MLAKSPTAHDSRPPFQVGPSSRSRSGASQPGPRSWSGLNPVLYGLLLLALLVGIGTFAPMAHADVGATGDDVMTDSLQFTSTEQVLGTGLSGTMTEATMYVEDTYTPYTNYLAMILCEYASEADYDPGTGYCGGTTLSVNSSFTFGYDNAGGGKKLATWTGSYDFNPDHFYVMAEGGNYNSASDLRIYGSSGDPWGGGDCNGDGCDSVVDMYFVFVGVSGGAAGSIEQFTHVVNTGPVPEGTDPFTQYASLEGTTQTFSGDFYITQQDYDNEYGPTIDEVWVYIQNMDVDNRIETLQVGTVDEAGEGSFSYEKDDLLDNTTYRYFYYFASSEDPGTTYFYDGIRYTFTIGENAQAAALGLTDLDDRMGLATSTCTVLNPTGCVQNAAVFLFWPSGSSLAQFQTLSLRNSFPFSYIYQFGAIKDALYGNADMAPASIAVDITGFGEITFLSRDMVAAVPFAGLIKDMLAAVLWFFLAYALYRAVIKAHDSQTHV